MLRELELNLIAAVSAAILCFIGGLIFAEPLKRWVEQRRRLSRLKKQKPIPVRIFPILFPFPPDDLKRLFLRENQNRLQSLFQFEVVNWQRWPESGRAEERLRTLQTNSRLEFAE